MGLVPVPMRVRLDHRPIANVLVVLVVNVRVLVWFTIHTVFRETWPVRGLGLFYSPVFVQVEP